jgi:hypothetical protein
MGVDTRPQRCNPQRPLLHMEGNTVSVERALVIVILVVLAVVLITRFL